MCLHSGSNETRTSKWSAILGTGRNMQVPRNHKTSYSSGEKTGYILSRSVRVAAYKLRSYADSLDQYLVSFHASHHYQANHG